MSLGKISVVLVTRTASEFERAVVVDRHLDQLGIDHETVVVSCNADDEQALFLNEAIHRIPDATVLFLHTDRDQGFAHLVGVDNAIGDWVLIAGPLAEDIGHLQSLIGTAKEGYSHIVPTAAVRSGKSWIYRQIEKAFFRLYVRIGQVAAVPDAPVTRLLSRPLALYVVTNPHGEMLLKCQAMPPGFATARIDATEILPAENGPRRSLLATSMKGLSVFVSTGAAPLRLVTLFALATGALNLLYIFYIIVSYFLAPHLASGWTTLSLQIAGLYFICMIFFILIGEYIARMSASVSFRLIYSIVREQRSRQSRTKNQLNIHHAEAPQ
jgi:polyisoprenyl-phosphate glycosyltransferase